MIDPGTPIVIMDGVSAPVQSTERVRPNQIEHQREDADDHLHSVSIIGDHMEKYRIRSKIDMFPPQYDRRAAQCGR
jgi:hypothetical protein